MNSYCIINTQEKMNVKKISKMKTLCPTKLYHYYIQRKLPIIMKDIEYLGEKGQEIILPFTRKELEELEVQYRINILDKIIKKYDIRYLYIAPYLRKLLGKLEESFHPSCNSLLLYIMFPQILEQVIQENNIDKKEMHLVIIDSGNRKIEYILELLGDELNHLTIITPRPEYFNEFVDIIYDNTGLIIEVISNLNVEDLKGNVIIDLSNSYNKYLKKNAVIIDMESSLLKRQYQYSRKKELSIVYDIVLQSNNQIVNSELLEFLLFRNHIIIKEFFDNKNRIYLKDGLTELGIQLELKVEKCIYL